MKSIEFGTIGQMQGRVKTPVQLDNARPAARDSGPVTAAQPASGGPAGLAGAKAPVDRERVAEIRKAVEQGRYPLVPARSADAMIAAGFILRTDA